jgi:acetyltransferase-like isoleucine patch superfamily enzyme
MSLRQHVGNFGIGLMPTTRAYPLKSWLLRCMGANVAPTARVTSSVRWWGTVHLTIGHDSFLGHEVLITGGDASVSIGSSVDIAPRVTIVAGTHDVDMRGVRSAGRPHSLDVKIEDGAWIGANVTILGGVTIGRNAVIAAGSVVTKDIPPFVVAAGIPCQPRKLWNVHDESWQRVEAAVA